MTNKTILDAVHETVKGLHKAGAMDATTMREFDALCLPPVKNYSAGCVFHAIRPPKPRSSGQWFHDHPAT